MSGTADAQRAWLARVLGVTVPPAGAARAGQARDEIAQGMGQMTMAFRKARLRWGAARGAALATITSLQQRLRDVLQREPDFAALDAEIAKFSGIMAGLDDRLETTLDRAMKGGTAADMAAAKQQAQAILADYRHFVEGHPFLRKIDGNDFMPVQVFSVLSAELQSLGQELGS